MEEDSNIENLDYHLTQLIELLSHPGYEHVTQDFLSWLRHVIEEKHQMEFDFGQIESISEARDMLKENIEAWKQNLIVTGVMQGREEGLTLGRVEGKTLGREEGILIGEALLLERLLKRRFGELPDNITHKLRYATQEELESWSYAVLDAKSLKDIFQDL
ncbi:MAG TPA: hypothetical protein DDW29_15865 [Gammaproteobacteria bacterium]|nr:hypothetical protein [Gammaproteobacteria bacterium]|tara:strand:+ start:222 stop:701 length:480 start_codon:yes stop_codon:yes gene_type:complete